MKPSPHNSHRLVAVACVLLGLAVLFVVLGVAQGDVLDTLHKAALICFECIGIG